MVASHDICQDICAQESVPESVRDDEIINPPPCVFLSGAESVRPPGIDDFFRMQIPEGICESCFEKFCHLASLLVRETRVSPVGLRILEIDLVVRNIEVAAVDDWLCPVKLTHILSHGIFKLAAVADPGKSVLGIRNVAAYEEEFRILECYDSPLVIMVSVDAIAYRNGFAERFAGKDSRSRIPLLFGLVVEFIIIFRMKISLPCLHLSFLQAEKIRVQCIEYIFKSLAQNSPEAIDIPADEFHMKLISLSCFTLW